MTGEPLRAELLLDRQLSEDTGRDVRTALTALGVTVHRTARTRAHRGPDELQWLVLLSLPLQAFLSGLGAEAVRDAYTALKDIVRRIARRPPAPGADAAAGRPLVLQDTVRGLRIVLEPDLPLTAYQQLAALDLTRFRHGPLHYDLARGRWRSELDEAAG